MKALFIFVLIVVLSSSSMADTITIVGDEWCPYNCKRSQKPGFMIELVQIIFNKEGHTIQYEIVPWKRAKRGILNGVYDGIVGMAKNETTEKLYIFPDIELGNSQFCFYVAEKTEWEFKGIESLEKIQLGVINGYGYGADGTPIDNYIKLNLNTVKVHPVAGINPLNLIIKMILANRLTATIEDKMVMGYTLSQLNENTNLKEVGCLPEFDRVHIAFSPKNPKSNQYAQILSKGIENLKISGEYDRIIDNYTK